LHERLSHQWIATAIRFPSGQQYDLQFLPQALRLFGQFATTHAGHVNVSDQDFNSAVDGQFFHSLPSIRRSHYLASKVLQYGRCETNNERFVIYNEYDAGQSYSIRAPHSI
jgi:hypothetical protein